MGWGTEKSEFTETEKIVYGEECIQMGLAVATKYLPSERIVLTFVGQDYLECLRNLAHHIAETLPFSTLGKPISKDYPIHDLRTLLTFAPDFERIDCRVVAFETAIVLRRDQLADGVWLANIAYEKPSIHAQVVIQNGNDLFGIHYAANSFSNVFRFPTGKYLYDKFALSGTGIYNFEHAVNTI